MSYWGYAMDALLNEDLRAQRRRTRTRHERQRDEGGPTRATSAAPSAGRRQGGARKRDS